ncbi:hypothetical protein J2W40_003198 [Sphingobium xenophagum]|uniref:Uncharacterized protein n=1 Tax=Sphingobium xenophagum TaxID=121428 RepID=A0ABU1X439_SPHXE|nr:hypothetical protein [Sphingobium xenophagum]MDR7156357.1 hypothetical protein [Sphingobium xenophagum]
MGDQTIMSLVTQLEQFDPEATIFAAEPWQPSSAAKLFVDVTTTEAREGLAYFLEIGIALDVLSEMGSDPIDRSRRLIAYATDDC